MLVVEGSGEEHEEDAEHHQVVEHPRDQEPPAPGPQPVRRQAERLGLLKWIKQIIYTNVLFFTLE